MTYAFEHFDAEETLMQSVEYPEFESHRAKHDEFRNRPGSFERATRALDALAAAGLKSTMSSVISRINYRSFRDLRLVLVLPGRDPKMVVMAHKLAPRFIAYADNGYEQIGAVLEKMIDASRKKCIAPAISLAGDGSQIKGFELKG